MKLDPTGEDRPKPKKPAKKRARKAAASRGTKGKGKGKKAGGRPSLYRDEYPAQAEKLCRLGATDKELADFFEVSVDTINEWKKVHAGFSESLKKGKGVADAEVADRLFKRACGYSHTDTKFATFEGQITDREEYEKHYPPDTIACIFWLKNRRPDLWRDKVGLEHTGANGGPIQSQGEFRPTTEDEEVIRRIRETRERLQQPPAEEGA